MKNNQAVNIQSDTIWIVIDKKDKKHVMQVVNDMTWTKAENLKVKGDI